MIHKPNLPGSTRTAAALLSSLALLVACKRDIQSPLRTSAETSAQVTARVKSLNPLAGQPSLAPVMSGVITTLPGSSPTNPTLNTPWGIASDASGNLYVADEGHNQIVKMTAFGSIIATYGKGGPGGFQDGPAASAQFNAPAGIAVDINGTIYVADQLNNRIRTISTSGVVSTLAGNNKAGFNDGQGTIATFKTPTGVAVDGNGEVYVADQGNNMIRRISPTGGVTRWAGQLDQGSADGNGSLASFNRPQGLCVAPNGSVYVADLGNNKIRKIRSGNVTTVAGKADNSIGTTDGKGPDAGFSFPTAVSVDADSNLYVTEFRSAVRFITPDSVVTTVAGGGSAGFKDSYDNLAEFKFPSGIIVTPVGTIFIADQGNNAIRRMDLEPGVKTVASFNFARNTAIDVGLSLAVAKDGTLLTTNDNGDIVKITPGTGAVTTFMPGVGFGARVVTDASGNIATYDGTTVKVFSPTGVPLRGMLADAASCPVFDAAGNVYVLTAGDKVQKLPVNQGFTTIQLNHDAVRTYKPVFNVTGAAGLQGWKNADPFETFTQLAIDPAGNFILGNGFGVYKTAPDGSNFTTIAGGNTSRVPILTNNDGIYIDNHGNPLTTQALILDPTFYVNNQLGSSNIVCNAAGNIYAVNEGLEQLFGIGVHSRINIFRLPGQGQSPVSLMTGDANGDAAGPSQDGPVFVARTSVASNPALSLDGKKIYFFAFAPNNQTLIRVISAL